MKSQSPPANQNVAGGLDTRDVLRCIALVIVAIGIWCFAFNRWSAETWRVPLEYGVQGADADALGVLADIKAAADGHFWPLMPKYVPELGAPFGANWNDFPFVEQLIYFLTGVVAKCIGLFAAANLAVMVAFILTAVSFYLVCRALNAVWTWSFAGALIYAFAHYAFTRQIHHLQVLYYFCVPLCLLVVWWLSSRDGLQFGGRRYWIGVGIAALAGLLHPYYTNMFVQLAGIACFVQFVRGNRNTAFTGLSIIGVSLAVFLVMCANVFLYKFSHGGNPTAMTRAFMWLEFSALKPLDMFMPPPDHRLAILAAFAQNYFKNVFVPGEAPPGSYLGVIGIAALVWLGFVSARRMLSQPPQLPPLEAWQVLWITLYSVVGGLNCFGGAFGIQIFRSSNRYSIFILAIVLIYAIRHISAFRLSPAKRFVFPGILCLIGLWDQIPRPPTLQQIEALNQVINSDRALMADLKTRVPKDAMVFQLPLMEFPEAPAPGVSPYDHFRLYLNSENLRFSFGSSKGRLDTEWQKRLAQMDFRSVIDTLESCGFSALYINRNGFADRGDKLIQALAEMGRGEVIHSPSGDRLCVLLKPSPYPVKPF